MYKLQTSCNNQNTCMLAKYATYIRASCIHVHAKSGHELTHFDKKRPKNSGEAIKPAYLPVQKIILVDYDMQFINM